MRCEGRDGVFVNADYVCTVRRSGVLGDETMDCEFMGTDDEPHRLDHTT